MSADKLRTTQDGTPRQDVTQITLDELVEVLNGYEERLAVLEGNPADDASGDTEHQKKTLRKSTDEDPEVTEVKKGSTSRK